MRFAVAAIHGPPNRRVAIVIQNQVGMSSITGQPTLYFCLGLRDRVADGLFRRVSVGVGGRARNIAFVLQTLLKLVVGAPDVLFQDVATRGFVLAQVAWRAIVTVNLEARLNTARFLP